MKIPINLINDGVCRGSVRHVTNVTWCCSICEPITQTKLEIANAEQRDVTETRSCLRSWSLTFKKCHSTKFMSRHTI